MAADFVHLHVHTQYSLLDGLNRSDKLFAKVKESGMDSVAITDHGVMYGIPEFWTMSKDFGVKPILGSELYLAPASMELRQELDGIKYYHLLVIAKNKVGYHNLIKLVSESHLRGMYYKPRVDLETLKKYSEGLICTSACLAGPLATHIGRDELDKAEDWLQKLHSIFKDDFYLEIQRNGIRCEDKVDEELIKTYPEIEQEEDLATLKLQVKVNQRLYDFSKRFKIPLIATTDAHYLDRSDKDIQKILFCIKDGKPLDDPSAMNGYVETYIKTPEELKVDFADIPEVLTETVKIGEKIEHYDIKYDRVQPKFWNIPEGKNSQIILADEVYRGALLKYPNELEDKEKIKNTQELKTAEEIRPLFKKSLSERLDYELEVIHNKGYDDYFLVVSDIMKWSAQNGILTGVRGSVAGSAAAHCLDIVELEPIKWQLYFERFLNPERPSPPDIDMDIQDSRRDELIQYVKDKYGTEAVAAICAIGRLKTKAAIRDVARVMNIDLKIADKLSKMVIVLFGKPKKFDEMMEIDPEFKSIVESDPRLIELGKIVKKIEGLSRHMSVHACGYLVTPGPIVDYCALQKETGGERIITQWEGPWMEELGLMKFDFLGLRTLTIISDTLTNIKHSKGEDISFYEIPEGDKKTYELLGRGETIGVFQFESPPMQKYLIDLQPESQEDLCFMAAAYRPGPMKYIPDYIKCKHKEKEPEFIIEDLKPIIGNTYGFAIYQEQVIKIAVDLAGYSMGGADILRRAMGKKKKDVMEKEEVRFKEGVMERGHSERIAQKLWEYLLPFADYGFNKAHAAGYAVLAYKCAYLKAHYPLEFMTALMHADLGNPDRTVTDMKEASRLGFSILQPSVNNSFVYFTPEGEKGIRFGLGAIKNVGNKICEAIVQERQQNGEFQHMDDLVRRVGPKELSKKTLEHLVKAGALDQFGDRNALLKIIPEVYQKCEKDSKAAEMGQTDLFGAVSGGAGTQIDATKTPFPSFEPATDREKIDWEKELLGMFVTTHPLQNFRWSKIHNKIVNCDQISDLENQQQIKILGMFSDIRVIHTKKDNSRMCVLQIEDMSGKADAVIFPKSFEQFEKLGLIEENRAFVITGQVNDREDRRSVIIQEIEPANIMNEPKEIKIDIRNIHDKSDIEKLGLVLKKEQFENHTRINIIYGVSNASKEMVRYADIRSDVNLNILSQWVI